MRFLLEMLGQAVGRLVDGEPGLLDALGRTAWLALASAAVALLVGLPVGAAIGLGRGRTSRVSLALANAGLGLPPVVLGVLLALVLLPGSLLGQLGWSNTIQAVVLAQVLLALPLVVALAAAAVAALPRGLLAQASALGASRAQVVVLALREAWIGVVTAALAALGSAIAEVGAVVIVGGNQSGRTDTLASRVLLDLAAGDPVGATADVLVLLVLLVVLGATLTLVQQRHGRA